jgi:hypothetical protein
MCLQHLKTGKETSNNLRVRHELLSHGSTEFRPSQIAVASSSPSEAMFPATNTQVRQHGLMARNPYFPGAAAAFLGGCVAVIAAHAGQSNREWQVYGGDFAGTKYSGLEYLTAQTRLDFPLRRYEAAAGLDHRVQPHRCG